MYKLLNEIQKNDIIESESVSYLLENFIKLNTEINQYNYKIDNKKDIIINVDESIKYLNRTLDMINEIENICY